MQRGSHCRHGQCLLPCGGLWFAAKFPKPYKNWRINFLNPNRNLWVWQDKTGGKVIYRTGGVVYAFRGRNYNYRASPRIPLMLWKPASPIYPMLVPKAPLGLTGDEAYQLRVLGQKVEPLCKLGKFRTYYFSYNKYTSLLWFLSSQLKI
jgi:hypothetical protein